MKRIPALALVGAGAMLLILVPLRPGPAYAGSSVLSSSKIDDTTIRAGNPYISRVWLADEQGNLWSRQEYTFAPWKNWGVMTGGLPVSDRGVTTVSYDVGMNHYESVLFVGTDGFGYGIYELVGRNRSAVGG